MMRRRCGTVAVVTTSSDRSRLGLPLALTLAIVLALPGLGAPLFHDDVIHRAMLGGKLPGMQWGPFELYDFIGGPGRAATVFRDRGFTPWSTADDLNLRLFRPLPSALIAMDANVFGERAWPARLHGLVWFLGIVSLVSVLYRRFLPGATAGLATVMYTIAGAHLLPVSWIAARHGLVTTMCALLAFWLHIRAREDAWSLGRWLAPLVVVVGLFGGEMGLGAVALILVWEVLARTDAWRLKLTAVAPYLLVAAGYLTFYVASGYGAHGSGLYLSPGDGIAVAPVVIRRLLILMGEIAAATPSDAFGLAAPGVQVAAAIWGAAAGGLAYFLLRVAASRIHVREWAALTWMIAAAVATAVPGTLAPIGGRVLTLALFPGLGVMAIVLARSYAALREGDLRGRRRALTATIVVVLAIGHLILGPAIRLGAGWWLGSLATQQHALAAQLQPCQGTNVLVVASDPTIATYVPAIVALEGRAVGELHVLSMAPYDHRIENVTETGFELAIVDPALAPSPWQLLYRGTPLIAGTRVTLPALDIDVLEVRNEAPARLRFDFHRPLASREFCFFQWHEGRIAPMAAPTAGTMRAIPYERGPIE